VNETDKHYYMGMFIGFMYTVIAVLLGIVVLAVSVT